MTDRNWDARYALTMGLFGFEAFVLSNALDSGDEDDVGFARWVIEGRPDFAEGLAGLVAKVKETLNGGRY